MAGKDPRDKIGKNPTGRERKSSGRARRKAERKLDRDLEGTRFEKPPKKGWFR